MKPILIAACALAVLGAADAAGAKGPTTNGAVAGAVGGAVVAGPVGAVVGGVGGAVIGHHARRRPRTVRHYHHYHHIAKTTSGSAATPQR
ncbi:MAG: hypothetical protein ACR2F8_03945 [Caulobacteraceae bacterium]